MRFNIKEWQEKYVINEDNFTTPANAKKYEGWVKEFVKELVVAAKKSDWKEVGDLGSQIEFYCRQLNYPIREK